MVVQVVLRATFLLPKDMERDDLGARDGDLRSRKAHAHEALPRLRKLLQDHRRSHFGERVTVADAAKRESR